MLDGLLTIILIIFVLLVDISMDENIWSQFINESLNNTSLHSAQPSAIVVFFGGIVLSFWGLLLVWFATARPAHKLSLPSPVHNSHSVHKSFQWIQSWPTVQEDKVTRFIGILVTDVIVINDVTHLLAAAINNPIMSVKGEFVPKKMF